MDPEDAPGIFAVRASFFAVTGAVTSVPLHHSAVHLALDGDTDVLDRQVLVLQPFTVMQCGQGLFGGRDEVFVRFLVAILGDLVQFFVELLQLGRFGHVIPEHEVRRLVWFVTLAPEELKAVVDQSQVQEEAISGKAVATMADNLHRSLGVIAVESGQHLMMREAVSFLDFAAFGRPFSDESVEILDHRLTLADTDCYCHQGTSHASLLWTGTES